MSITKLTTNGLNGTKYDIVSADNYYMEPIATTLVGAGGVSSIAFTNIPQGYKNLQLRGFSRDTGNSATAWITLNSDSNANYTTHRLYGNGTSVTASGFTGLSNVNVSFFSVPTGRIASAYGAAIIDVLDYTNTNKYKTFRYLVGRDQNDTDGFIGIYSALWLNTAPITSMTITSAGTAFDQHSRFSLYGIKG